MAVPAYGVPIDDLDPFRVPERGADAGQVRVGERSQLDVTLEPAQLMEVVQVVAESPQLETSTASIGGLCVLPDSAMRNGWATWPSFTPFTSA